MDLESAKVNFATVTGMRFGKKENRCLKNRDLTQNLVTNEDIWSKTKSMTDRLPAPISRERGQESE